MENAIAMTRAIPPWQSSVSGAPICCETAPTTKLPRGSIPNIAIAAILITLPLMEASASTCIMVIQIVDWDIIPKPPRVANNIANGK